MIRARSFRRAAQGHLERTMASQDAWDFGALSGFLLELYRDARSEAPHVLRARTLATLRELIPFDFAAWGGGAERERLVTDVVMLDQSRALFDAWAEVAAEDAFCDLALERIDRTVGFADVEGFRGTMAWNEHWRRFDAHDMISTIAAEPLDGYVTFLGLCIADPKRAFSERDRRVKQLLAPHLSAALRQSRESVVDGALIPSEGVALVDREGWILATRAPFGQLAREEWTVVGPRVPSQVWSAMREQASFRGHAVQFHVRRLGPDYLLRARPRAPLDDLTRREAQVAEVFARGLSYKEAAMELGIAPVTVRNHLAKIYDKLGIGSKTELVRLLSDC